MLIKEYVDKYDPENQFDVLKQSYEQVDYVLELNIDLSDIKREKIRSVVVAGLGGSAIGGDLIGNLFNEELAYPYSVSRNYNLPKFVNENSLVILSSYSGNTEETLSAAEEAKEKGAQIICVTTGGKLEKFASQYDYNLVKLKTGYQPRYSLYLNMLTVAKILNACGLISADDSFIKEIRELLYEKGKEYAEENSPAYTIAESLVGFIPVIYSCDSKTNAVGIRLKGQFNENAKVHAFHNSFPELNHNEIIGWETQQENQFRTKVIFIEDESYHLQIQRRFNITAELIEKSSTEIIALKSSLNDFKLRLLDIIFLGDWVSYYLAVLRGKDPSEIDFIHHLKNELAK